MGRLAKAARSGTVALSMGGVEKEMTSVAMDASYPTAFAPASLLTRNVDLETGRLVPDLVWATVARRMGSAELLILTAGRAVKRVLLVLA